MDDDRERSNGKPDLATILYIGLGIPSIVGFVAILFLLTRACGLPA